MNKSEKELLNSLVHYSKYWANLPKERLMPNKYETIEECRTNGLIHSILVLLRGDSSSNDFKHFTIKQGRNIVGEKEYLPSRYFDIYNRISELEKNNE